MVVILIMDNSKTPTVYSFIYYVFFVCVCLCVCVFYNFCFVGFFRGGVYWNLRYWPNPHFSIIQVIKGGNLKSLVALLTLFGISNEDILNSNRHFSTIELLKKGK
jgi:hypothetical protein